MRVTVASFFMLMSLFFLSAGVSHAETKGVSYTCYIWKLVPMPAEPEVLKETTFVWNKGELVNTVFYTEGDTQYVMYSNPNSNRMTLGVYNSVTKSYIGSVGDMSEELNVHNLSTKRAFGCYR
ncbi:MAG: hypothetical protein KDD45_04955 [Bdellovibrionales bacterium]|nr:hypothetical protein [Bdellovibrionales bacterium]